MELIRLRVKDLNLDRLQLTVRAGNGGTRTDGLGDPFLTPFRNPIGKSPTFAELWALERSAGRSLIGDSFISGNHFQRPGLNTFPDQGNCTAAVPTDADQLPKKVIPLAGAMQLNGERGRPTRSFWRPAENISCHDPTYRLVNARGAGTVGGTPTGATGTVALPKMN